VSEQKGDKALFYKSAVNLLYYKTEWFRVHVGTGAVNPDERGYTASITQSYCPCDPI